MRGPKPKPTVQRITAGNPGGRPINTREPTPPAVDPAFDEPPVELIDPRAIVEWRRLAPMLRRCRQVTQADRAALLACCIEWARYLEARDNAQPRILTASRSGYRMPNPWLAIQTRALAACMKLWPELGLTPSSRTRIAADGPGPEGDAFSEFDEALGGDAARH
jgi:P27 family predicted phage terminase small subunit